MQEFVLCTALPIATHASSTQPDAAASYRSADDEGSDRRGANPKHQRQPGNASEQSAEHDDEREHENQDFHTAAPATQVPGIVIRPLATARDYAGW